MEMTLYLVSIKQLVGENGPIMGSAEGKKPLDNCFGIVLQENQRLVSFCFYAHKSPLLLPFVKCVGSGLFSLPP